MPVVVPFQFGVMDGGGHEAEVSWVKNEVSVFCQHVLHP